MILEGKLCVIFYFLGHLKVVYLRTYIKLKLKAWRRKRKYGGVVKVKMCYCDWCQSFVAPKYNDYSNAKVNWDSGSQVEEWIHYI